MQFSSTMCSNKIEYEETRIAIRRFLPTRYTFGFVALDSAMINAIICNPHLPHYTYDNAVIGELSFRNEYDGHTTDRMLDWTERIMGRRPKLIASDRGYRGRKQSVLGIPYWIRFNSYRSKDFADSTKSSMFSFIIL